MADALYIGSQFIGFYPPTYASEILTSGGDTVQEVLDDIEDVESNLGTIEQLLQTTATLPSTASSFSCNWSEYYSISIELTYYGNVLTQVTVPTSWFDVTSSSTRVYMYTPDGQSYVEVYKNANNSVYLKATGSLLNNRIRIYGIGKK